MKITKETVEVTYYVCQTCGKRSKNKRTIEKCEASCKQNKCNHKDDWCFASMEYGELSITKQCKLCDEVLGQRDISEETLDSDYQRMLEELYDENP